MDFSKPLDMELALYYCEKLDSLKDYPHLQVFYLNHSVTVLEMLDNPFAYSLLEDKINQYKGGVSNE